MLRRTFIKNSLATSALPIVGLGASAAAEPTARFAKDFIWGAATAAYQIEGAWNVDGKGESIWDRFCHTKGAIKNGDTGDVACDSYHRYPEDVALLKRLNVKSYRYSLSWPRIQATGRGAINQKGLDYYRRLTDAVLSAGIRPLVTLYHWDLPQALEDNGGWPNRETAERFADYAEIVARALGDRVQHWVLLNEPKTFTSCGYWYGNHAPGRKDPLAFVRATHTSNLAQGLGFKAMRAINGALKIGSAFDVAPMYAFSESKDDKAAAERWHRFQNLWFIAPALTGRYPDGVLHPDKQASLLGWQQGDEARVRAPLDFVGLNYYTPVLVKNAPQGNGVPDLNTQNFWATMHGSHPKTDVDWTIYPQGFYDVLIRMKEITGALPIEITENGAAFNEGPNARGSIEDTRRIDYLRGHLKAVARAIQSGVPIRGYHCWSLLDNFEWAEGYSQRFGIVHVDFKNGQRRRIKASGKWYADVCTNHYVT